MVVWMANCGGPCSSFSGAGNVWFKIEQAGLISGTLSKGLWVCEAGQNLHPGLLTLKQGSGEMINNSSSWAVTIPKTLKPGNYLIRHETIALHTSNAPQWYEPLYTKITRTIITDTHDQVPRVCAPDRHRYRHRRPIFRLPRCHPRRVQDV